MDNEEPVLEGGTATPRRAVSRRNKSPQGASNVSHQPSEVSAPGLRDTNIQRSFFSTLLFGFFFALVGTLPSIYASWLSLVGPIAMVVGFYFYGIRQGWAQHADTRQRFADGCYFLGFLFTMWALLVGFVPAGLGLHELSSTEILRHFGMALGATAAGLIGRILVLQSAGIDDSAAEVEADLREFAIRVAEETRAIADTLTTVRSQMMDANREAIEKSAEAFAKALEQTSLRLSSATEAMVATIGEGVQAAQSATRSFTTNIEAQDRNVDTAARKSVASHEALGANAASLASELGGFQTALADGRAILIASLVSASDEMRRLTVSLQSGDAGVARVESALGSIDARLGVISERTDALANHLADDREAIDAHREELAQMRQQAVANLRGDGATFEADITRATAEFARIVDTFANELSELRQRQVDA